MLTLRCDSDRIHWAKRAQELEETVEELKLKLANSEADFRRGRKISMELQQKDPKWTLEKHSDSPL